MKPNFLLITTDQQRADHVGCYGNPVVRTPNIDALAGRGVRFDNFYVASPVCMANRASIMTGCMPSIHGVRSNGIPLSLRRTTFCDLMQAAGYRTALVGKAHLQNMTGKPAESPRAAVDPKLAPPPSELAELEKALWADGAYNAEDSLLWHRDPTHRMPAPYYGFEEVDLCTLHGDLVHGDYYRWLSTKVADPEGLRGPANAYPDGRYVLAQAYKTRVPEELYPTRYIENQTIAKLRALCADPDRPFMLHCSFPDPHHPFTPPGHYWDMYNPDEMIAPKTLSSNLPRTPAVEALHQERLRGDANLNSTVPFAVTEREAREAIALTYGMITMIDDAIGRIVGELRALGVMNNTIIIFMSDHGDFMGDHGLMLKGALHYRGLIRVPFMWIDPAGNDAGKVQARPSSTIDIAPTILRRAGLAPSHGVQGIDLFGDGADDDERTIVVEEDGHAPAFGLRFPVRARSALTDRYRLTIYDETDWIELYDLKDDPDELHNLAHDARYTDVKSAMFERMARALTSLANRSPFPTGRA